MKKKYCRYANCCINRSVTGQKQQGVNPKVHPEEFGAFGASSWRKLKKDVDGGGDLCQFVSRDNKEAVRQYGDVPGRLVGSAGIR